MDHQPNNSKKGAQEITLGENSAQLPDTKEHTSDHCLVSNKYLHEHITLEKLPTIKGHLKLIPFFEQNVISLEAISYYILIFLCYCLSTASSKGLGPKPGLPSAAQNTSCTGQKICTCTFLTMETVEHQK